MSFIDSAEDNGAAGSIFLDREIATNHVGSIAHNLEPHSLRMVSLRIFDPETIVANLEFQPLLITAQFHHDVARFPMANGVADSLLGYTV